ncbi:glycerate kinase [Arthrobacter sp. 92]|uniref:glycerate kinase n=1 Tax=Arthrobacter sp. 92 TaxID=3418175 RepID=UPI003CFC963A
MSATVLIAPDSFKGTAMARDVAEAVATGWHDIRPHDVVRILPMADGGEGTLEAIESAIPGAQRVSLADVQTLGPASSAYWLRLPDNTGVVELAVTNGLGLYDELRPLDADTFEFGQVIAAAIRTGVHRLILGIGGSASSDGGAAVLSALGAKFMDRSGHPIVAGARGLLDLAVFDPSGLRALPPGGVRVLTDVVNPLLGVNGAARIYGPQKGATPTDVDLIERGLANLASLLPVDPETPGAGAAGGTGFGLLAWGAEIVSGAHGVGKLCGFERELHGADVVITGEGRFDEQSLYGKIVGHVAGQARAAERACLLVAGSITAPTSPFAAHAELSRLAGTEESARNEPLRWLRRAGSALASEWRGPLRTSRT